jgi:hypothetical protein
MVDDDDDGGTPTARLDTLLDIATELMAEDDGAGVCRSCLTITYGVEPDARRYLCQACGRPEVYGAEQLVVMYA